MSKPSNKELYDKYLTKQQHVKLRYTQAELLYLTFKSESSKYIGMMYEIVDLGHRTMLHNLSGQLAHCRQQLKKFSIAD